MSDTIKTILATIGSAIIVIFLVFCIAMCTSGFRNGIYDAMNVVPEKEYNQELENKNLLNLKITEYTTQIDALNTERNNLLGRIAELDLTNSNQAKLLVEYQEKISRLNQEIINLTAKFQEITANVSNATINYRSFYSTIFMAFFDVNGNYSCHGGYHETHDYKYGFNGYDLYDFLNSNGYNQFSERVSKSISRFQTYLYEYDVYEVIIDNHSTQMDVIGNELVFADDAVINAFVNYDNNQMSVDDFMKNIDLDSMFEVSISFDYSVNAVNFVDNLTLNLNITKI
ncbi:MAG: hypothetical protein IJZ29_01175 [Clostridia bacterium]|nr:hypothetical protein [Clostridia bacterium]